ncbi:MAG: methyl-accepting chemotaxis protein, partial [Pseudomonadota bacterium]
VGVGIVAMTILIVTNMEIVSDKWRTYEQGVAAKSHMLSRIRDSIGYGGVVHEYSKFIASQDLAIADEVTSRLSDFRSAVDIYGALAPEPAELALLEKISGTVDGYGLAMATAQEMFASGATSLEVVAAVEIDDGPAMSAFNELEALLNKQRREQAKSMYGTVDMSVRHAVEVGAFLVVLVCAAFGLVLWFAVWRVIKPIARIGSDMQALAAGLTEIDLVDSDRGDEIGDMTKAVAVFRDNAVERNRLQNESEREGALRLERQKRIEDMITTFRSSVQTRLEAVGANTTQMQSAVDTLSAMAEETSSQASSANAASGAASEKVQAVAVAAEELAGSIDEISRQIDDTNKVVDQANATADATNAKVASLADAASRIGQVVSLIRDIAEQTNLLALNATIEAARAGDAGRGFAVVAAEVKELATQTGKATEEISGQIGAIQSETDGAVTAIGAISTIMKDVTTKTAEIAAAVQEQGASTVAISRNVQEVASGSATVSQNVDGVTAAATETAASIDRIVTASTDVADQAGGLRIAVDDFLKKVSAA